MKRLMLQNAIVTPTEIVPLRKEGNITIAVEDISIIFYEKPTFGAFLFGTLGAAESLRYMLNREIGGTTR